MTKDYAELLKKAKKALPSLEKSSGERFEIPKVIGHLQGNRTVISNFLQIANTLNREPDQFLKFLLKELATPGELNGNLLIIGTKVHSASINEKIKKYADEFVICKTCSRPDTKLVNEQGVWFLRCQACGAKNPVRAKV